MYLVSRLLWAVVRHSFSELPQLAAAADDGSRLDGEEAHHRVVEICSARCRNTTSRSHFILLYADNMQTPSMQTNKKCSRTISDKCEFGQCGWVVRGKVRAADAWILASHCTDELR